jgi:hypothetical protein
MWIAMEGGGTAQEESMTLEPVLDNRHTTPIRRLTDGSWRWRVMVETWHESDAFHGRLLFRRDGSDRLDPDRPQRSLESAALLHGRSREDVLGLAHDVPEEQLRRVLHSLG